jgi:ABC-type transport system substrate-binding protein
MCLLGWSADYGDIDNFLYVLLSKWAATKGNANNVSFYTDEETSRLLDAARSTSDTTEREGLYAEAQRRVFDQVPMIPFMHMPETRAVSKRVKGYVAYPAGGEYLFHCRVE